MAFTERSGVKKWPIKTRANKKRRRRWRSYFSHHRNHGLKTATVAIMSCSASRMRNHPECTITSTLEK